MIPLTMRLRVRKNGRPVVGLWFPVILVLVPVLILLVAISPLVLVAALFAAMGGQGGTVLRTYAFVLSVFFMISGLRIEVSDPENEFAIILR
jgi:hypothetical protein